MIMGSQKESKQLSSYKGTVKVLESDLKNGQEIEEEECHEREDNVEDSESSD